MTRATAGLCGSLGLFILCFSMLAFAFVRDSRAGMATFGGLTAMSLSVALLILAHMAGVESTAVTDTWRGSSP
jgi:hypothetical protein